jgi:hypothetical protein
MSKIIRTETRAEGGLTLEEQESMKEHSAVWIKRAMRTEPIDPTKIVPAIKELYAVSGLKEPRVVIVPSPRIMAFSGGFASAIWWLRKNQRSIFLSAATAAATEDATRAATEDAILYATEDATSAATEDATRAATAAATAAATSAATEDATRDATGDATRAAGAAATAAAIFYATEYATEYATAAATAAATSAATEYATSAATAAATSAATEYVTRDATAAATRAAGAAATRDATEDATSAATAAAILYATRAATRAATAAATSAATAAAILYATAAATVAATEYATSAATAAATSAATEDATRDATEYATRDATEDATSAAILYATRAATAAATAAATRDAEKLIQSRLVKFFLACAQGWGVPYQGGNMWAYYDCYLSSFRDVLGLKLPIFDKYEAWEKCAIEGGFRWMHEEFCIVSDFPEILKVDDQNRPHCDDGPSHRWRDGWELYYIHGVKVTRQIVMYPESITMDQVRKEENAEVRRVMIERMGWDKFCSEAKLNVIHKDTLTARFPAGGFAETVSNIMRFHTTYREGTEVAELLQSSEFKDLEDRPLKFVRVTDPSTGDRYILRVWPENKRAYEAIAQTFGMSEAEYKESILTHS